MFKSILNIGIDLFYSSGFFSKKKYLTNIQSQTMCINLLFQVKKQLPWLCKKERKEKRKFLGINGFYRDYSLAFTYELVKISWKITWYKFNINVK